MLLSSTEQINFTRKLFSLFHLTLILTDEECLSVCQYLFKRGELSFNVQEENIPKVLFFIQEMVADHDFGNIRELTIFCEENKVVKGQCFYFIKPQPIEPKILPLVDAINKTDIVKTFSSCQGHFETEEQELTDRNHANVRFEPVPDVSLHVVERFITYLITEFKTRHGDEPIFMSCYKVYGANHSYIPDYSFGIELTPYDRFEPSDVKRSNTDRAILQVVEIIQNYIIFRENK